MRNVLRFLLLLGVLLLVSPFLLTSLLVDQKGVIQKGQIVAKDEWITVGYSSWTRHQQITVKYQPPDEPGLAFLNADFGGDDKQFDHLHGDDTVELRYLLAQDGLHWPGIKTMRQMHLLPRARLRTQAMGSGLARMAWSVRYGLLAFALAVILLLGWRLLHLPYLGWLLASCFLVALVCSIILRFPVPTPTPVANVKHIGGIVKSVEVWKELFQSNQSQNDNRWLASEPVAIIGVRFTPKGRTDPVVAVDLIDLSSMPTLQEHTPVQIEYEEDTPRIAQIVGAQRQFARKNLNGLVSQALLIAITAVLLWCVALFFGRWYRSLIRKRR